MRTRKFLDRILKLPPAHDRVNIEYSTLARLVGPEKGKIKKEKDDLYIMYLIAKSTFVLGVALAGGTLLVYSSSDISQMLGIWDALSDGRSTKMLVLFRYYAHIYIWALLFLFLPFYIIKFRWNINPKKYDLLWYAARFKEEKKYPEKWWVVIPLMLVFSSLLLFMLLHVRLLPSGPFFNWYNTDTAASLVFYMSAAMLFIIPSFVNLVRAVMVIWRFLGPYEETTTRPS